MRNRYVVAAFLAIGGCASSRVMIEKPIADQCEATGLKGCPQLTEGVLLFIEGDQQRARHKLRLAINANEPDEVLAFADALRPSLRFPELASLPPAFRESSTYSRRKRSKHRIVLLRSDANQQVGYRAERASKPKIQMLPNEASRRR
jgi:hypothetical protein